jgi:hypothetical protein
MFFQEPSSRFLFSLRLIYLYKNFYYIKIIPYSVLKGLVSRSIKCHPHIQLLMGNQKTTLKKIWKRKDKTLIFLKQAFFPIVYIFRVFFNFSRLQRCLKEIKTYIFLISTSNSTKGYITYILFLKSALLCIVYIIHFIDYYRLSERKNNEVYPSVKCDPRFFEYVAIIMVLLPRCVHKINKKRKKNFHTCEGHVE